MNIDKDVDALGRLLGLLTSAGQFDEDWFTDPIASLSNMGSRLQNLAVIADDLLGPAKDAPSPQLPKAKWYAIPDPRDSAKKLPLFLTCGAPDQKSGEIGLGILDNWAPVGKLKAVTYVYFPLVSYSADGAAALPGSAAHPVQIGTRITTTGTFQGNTGDTFKAVDISSRTPLSGDTPSCDVTFELSSSKSETCKTLAELLDPKIRARLADVVLQSRDWLNGKATEKATRGDLLVAAGFLTKDKPPTDKKDAPTVYHLALDQLSKLLTQSEIAGLVFYGALKALAEAQVAVINLAGGGIFVDRLSPDTTGETFALRLQGSVALTGPPAKKGPPASSLTLTLGSWLTGENEKDKTTWLMRTAKSAAKPGISVSLLTHSKDGSTSFSPAVALVSVGINAKGAGDAPLFSIAGVSLRAAELRALVDWRTGDRGFAILLDKMGLPLGASFGTAKSKSNPVAQNLVASGDDKSAAQPGKTSAVAPAFRASAAYVKGHSPKFQILDDKSKEQDRVWFPVQTRYGPISCRRVGVTVHSTGPTLDVIFDGAVALAGLNVDLDQLTVGVPLKTVAHPSSYALDLRGIDVSYDGGPVKIGGGLVKVPLAGGDVEYDGEATIQTKTLALHALASYATLSDADGGGTSLFVFAFLNRPIGGPPCLYVTGVAAGFGYNRSLEVPTLANLRKFPLLAALADAGAIGGKNPTAASALAKLHDWVPPARGEYWLAAGARFTTFEVVNTSALLIARFGAELVVAVLGRSTLKQPIEGKTFVYAELDIAAEYRPSIGEFRASAVLAPGSYVLTPAAHLTGGFAFASWFTPSEHAGDFVFTIGGYHPAFKVPSHYPAVPRVGVNWQIDSHTAMVGGAYFAITPTAMMGGVAVQVTFSDGPLKAWLKASADGILFYKPFYLVVSASVSVGVSLEVHFLFVDVTLSAEIGADFQIWGPPIGFRVHVDWYVVSFTLGSGEPAPPPAISWEEFKTLLPSRSAAKRAAMVGDSASESAVLVVNARRGLASSQSKDDLTFWLVRAGQLTIDVMSAVPASQVVVKSGGAGGNRDIPGEKTVAMRSVNGGIASSDYRSTQTVRITVLSSTDSAHIRSCMASGGCGDSMFDIDDWEVDALTGALPPALWGDPVPKNQSADINPDTPTLRGTTGVTLRPGAPDTTNGTPAMDMESVFQDFTVNVDDAYELSIAPETTPCPAIPTPAPTFIDIAAIDEPATSDRRAALYAALSSLGINGWTNDPLPKMEARPGLAFADEPMTGQPLCEPAGVGAGPGALELEPQRGVKTR